MAGWGGEGGKSTQVVICGRGRIGVLCGRRSRMAIMKSGKKGHCQRPWSSVDWLQTRPQCEHPWVNLHRPRTGSILHGAPQMNFVQKAVLKLHLTLQDVQGVGSGWKCVVPRHPIIVKVAKGRGFGADHAGRPWTRALGTARRAVGGMGTGNGLGRRSSGGREGGRGCFLRKGCRRAGAGAPRGVRPVGRPGTNGRGGGRADLGGRRHPRGHLRNRAQNRPWARVRVRKKARGRPWIRGWRRRHLAAWWRGARRR